MEDLKLLELTPEALYDFEVLDAEGQPLGAVNHVWAHDSTDEVQLLGIRSGWLFGKTDVVPARGVRIELPERRLRLPYTAEQVRSAPRYQEETPLTPELQEKFFRHYGVSWAADSTHLGAPFTAASTADLLVTRPAPPETVHAAEAFAESTVSMPLAEERLVVGKREVEAGRVRLRKVVRTEPVEQTIELRREEVIFERIPATGAEIPVGAFHEQEVELPVLREEAVVAKEVRVVAEARLRKEVETVTETVHGQVRREELEVEHYEEVEGHPTSPPRR